MRPAVARELLRIEADAVILHGHAQAAVRPREGYLHLMRLPVLARVRQRLLQNAQQMQLRFGPEGLLAEVPLHV